MSDERRRAVLRALKQAMGKGEVHPTMVVTELICAGLDVTFGSYDSVEKLARRFMEGRLLVVLYHPNGPSYAVVNDVANGSISLLDPSQGYEIRFSHADFMMAWIGGGRGVLEIS